MKKLSSLTTPLRMPPSSRQNELTRKAPPLFPWRRAQSSRKLQARPSTGTASTTLRPAGEPRNRAGEEGVGGARPPALGGFHLNSASFVCILTPSPPPRAANRVWFQGWLTSNMSEVVKISPCLTQYPHCMGKLRLKDTHGINLVESISLKSQPFPQNLKVSPSVPPRGCAPALASYASTVSRLSQPGLLVPWPPVAASSSSTLPGTPSQTSHLQPFYGQQPIASSSFPQGTVLSLTSPCSQSTSLFSQSSQTVTAGRAQTG